MERGISKATENELIVNAARFQVESHFGGGGGGGGQRQMPPLAPSPESAAEYSSHEEGAVSADTPDSGITEHSLSSPPPPFSETTSAASGVSSGIGGSGGSGGGRSHFRSGSHGGSVINSYGFIETPLYTFTLPDLTVFQGARTNSTGRPN